MTTPLAPTEACARELDRTDTLAAFRDRFHLLPGTIYMDGNSLGLLSRDAEAALLRTLEEWKTQGIAGWFSGEEPWLETAHAVGALAAPMMGAAPDQVVQSATVTVNIHSLVASFYKPTGKRTKILADELNFPSDLYALQGQLKLHGRPADDLVLVPSDDGRTLDEDEIIARMTDEVALVWLPSVLYRSGQLLDLPRLAAAARERGIPLGFDCCHSAGAVPHELDAWGVDFATWCGYKYLNSGPGGGAFLYVNRRHFGAEPLLAGWFGNKHETMFAMDKTFDPQPDAGRWQISTPGVLGSSTLKGSLKIFNEAGIGPLREKSLRMTEYLMVLADELLADAPYGFTVGTPREAARRGGHVALERAAGAEAIHDALIARGVVPDFRPPNVLRLCPSALYGTYQEIWDTVQHLRAIIDAGQAPALG